MKLKRHAEDFVVEELPVVNGGDRGRFSFYRLSKRGLGTIEAIEAISRRWGIEGRRISYGGLKDRHARTIQYLTIFEGPERPHRESNFELEPLGRIDHPYGPPDFRGNRFEVTIRDLNADALDRATRAIAEIPRDGLPNYFDDQRFGSVGFDGGFIAEAWLKGDYEQAFRLAVAEPNPMDRPDVKVEKDILRDCWGRWADAKAKLDRSHSRSLVTYLVDHPTDFRGGFARIRRELRSLYFSAFQSYLWNLLLGRAIEQGTRPEQRAAIDFKVATLPIHRGLDPDQAEHFNNLHLPLPASRTPLPEGPTRDLALAVVAERGLTWEGLRVKHLKDVFFSKGERPATFRAARLRHRDFADESYPGRRAIRLDFELPKGAYATLIVKRITDAAAP